MRSFRRAAKHGFASKSRWLAFLPDRRHVKPNAQRSRFSMKAKTENFRVFVKDITLHIAAAHPLYVSREDVPGKLIEAEREIYKAQVKGKPANVTEKIVDGKLDKFYSTVCLLEQGFIKNPDVTIKDLLNGKIAELGENIVIRRFTRYLVGEPVPAEA